MIAVGECYWLLIAEAALIIGIVFIAARFSRKKISHFIFVPLLLFFFTLYFFRDPSRSITPGNDGIISPADGKVIQITNADILSISHKTFTRIDIYLSAFDVHINRIPASGIISYYRYNQGSFLPALSKAAAQENENLIVGISGVHGTVFVKQIAGIFARRIVCHINTGDEVVKGQKYGMIKFGSRVQIYLPEPCRVLVTEGEKVRAGITEVARYE